jgi:hypothetical protein
MFLKSLKNHNVSKDGSSFIFKETPIPLHPADRAVPDLRTTGVSPVLPEDE